MAAYPSNAAASRPLKIVAALFILVGIGSVLDTVVGLFAGRFVFNLGLIYLVIGRGLLDCNPRSFAWARFFTWIGIVLLPLAAVAALMVKSRFQLFGFDVRQMPYGFGSVFCGAAFALLLWQVSVLNSTQRGPR